MILFAIDLIIISMFALCMVHYHLSLNILCFCLQYIILIILNFNKKIYFFFELYFEYFFLVFPMKFGAIS